MVDFGEGTCSETEDCKSALQYCLKPGFGFDAEPTQVRLQFPGRSIRINIIRHAIRTQNMKLF